MDSMRLQRWYSLVEPCRVLDTAGRFFCPRSGLSAVQYETMQTVNFASSRGPGFEFCHAETFCNLTEKQLTVTVIITWKISVTVTVPGI